MKTRAHLGEAQRHHLRGGLLVGRVPVDEIDLTPDFSATESLVDSYDRAVARIFLWSDDGDALVDVSQQMIQQGGAWYFERFGRDRSMLIAESIARRTRAGLWSLPDRERVPPWEWRKMPKEERDLHR